MKIKEARIKDLWKLHKLFVDTIQSVCSKDYTSEQIAAWTSSIQDQERWIKKIEAQYFLIAEKNGTITGFASLENGSYLDMLYVHKDSQNQGVASKLFSALLEEAKLQGSTAIFSDVSITALSFFYAKGFKEVKKNYKKVQGVELINYTLILELA